MRGLPAPPPDVWRVIQTLELAGQRCSVGFWIFNPGSIAPTPGDLETFAARWILHAGPVLNAVTASDLSLGAFRTFTFGALPAQWEQGFPANHGLVPGFTLPLNVAGCITWTNNQPRGSHSRTLLPLPSTYLAPGGRLLNTTGIASLRTAALDLIAAVNAIPGISGDPCSLVTLHRQANSAPLPVAQVELLLGANPDKWVATCDRRIESRR